MEGGRCGYDVRPGALDPGSGETLLRAYEGRADLYRSKGGS